MAHRIYIHIGIHKTGTTAIQTFLDANRVALRRNGLLYPGARLYKGGHHKIPWSLGVNNQRAGDLEQDNLFDDLLHEIAGSDCTATLLSSEEFEFLNLTGVRTLHDRLADHDCWVIVYLRRQDSLLEAQYQAHVKMNEFRFTGDIHDFQQTHGVGRMNYRRLLERWAGVFDRNRIIVRPYERSQLTKGDAIDDICSVVGIDACSDYERPALGKSNVSLSAYATMAVRRLNGKPGIDGQTRGRLIRLLQRYDAGLDSMGAFLTPPARQAFIDRFEETNAFVAKEFLGRPDGILFSEPESATFAAAITDKDTIDYLVGFAAQCAR